MRPKPRNCALRQTARERSSRGNGAPKRGHAPMRCDAETLPQKKTFFLKGAGGRAREHGCQNERNAPRPNPNSVFEFFGVCAGARAIARRRGDAWRRRRLARLFFFFFL